MEKSKTMFTFKLLNLIKKCREKSKYNLALKINVISEKKEVNFTLMIELQQKEIKDLISDNTILLEEVKRLVKKINEMNKPKLEN